MHTAISSVKVYPSTANRLLVRPSGFNPPPTFQYELQEVTTVDGVERSTTLLSGNAGMTPDQWNNWATDADDEEYILDCVVKNLGLTRVGLT